MYKSVFLSLCCIKFTSCWDLYFDRGGIVYQDPEYINAFMNITRINKTSYSLTGKGDIVKDLPCSTKVFIRLLGEFSNTYKELPIKVTRTLKNVYQYEYRFIAPEIRKYTNLPEYCPQPKGSYYIKPFTPNLSDLKKHVPVIPWNTNKFLVDYSLVVIKEIMRVKFYVRITTEDEYNRE